MKYFDQLFSRMFVVVVFAVSATAQTDELRSATGLPIPIGQPAIYGKVTIKGLSKEESKPLVFVVLLEGGTQLGRIQTNDAGYYYFLASPRGSATLVFEVNNNEVGRMLIQGGAGVNRTLRQDITIDWPEFKQRAAVGVVSLNEDYPRDAANTKAF